MVNALHLGYIKFIKIYFYHSSIMNSIRFFARCKLYSHFFMLLILSFIYVFISSLVALLPGVFVSEMC